MPYIKTVCERVSKIVLRLIISNFCETSRNLPNMRTEETTCNVNVQRDKYLLKLTRTISGTFNSPRILSWQYFLSSEFWVWTGANFLSLPEAVTQRCS